MHFSQFYASPVFLNPAFTGAGTCARVSLTHRSQWNGFANPYKSSLLTFDHYLNNSHFGTGFIVAEEYAGSGSLKTTYIRPSIAFAVQLKKRYNLRLGIQPGIGIRSVNFNDLLFGDQIYRGGAGVTSIENPAQKKTFFDLSTGALISGTRFWAGLSFTHLNRPNESLMGSYSQHLPTLISLHGGIKLDLNPDEKEAFRKKYFTPVLHYRLQNKFDQLDIGFYLTRYVFTAGVWYRGIPGLQSINKSYINQDALVFVGGFQQERLKFGYSYDMTISGLKSISRGAHEISLSFQICNPKNRKTHYALISCPKF
jgi:type IX secretion system PorP/SprF family membrane protein